MACKKDTVAELKFPSSQDSKEYAVQQTIHTIQNLPAAIALDSQDLRLVVDEAITNAMEHGNHWQVDKFVKVGIIDASDSLFVTIKDEGSGFDTEKKIEGSRIKSIKNIRGRGMMILTGLCNVTWSSSGNEITVSIPYSDPPLKELSLEAD